MDKPSFIIVGYGRMGKLIKQVLDERKEIIRGIVDPLCNYKNCYSSIKDVKLSKEERSVAICFTTPEAGYQTTKDILERGIDAVVGTTKWYFKPDGSIDEKIISEMDEIAKSKNARFLYASNFSLGMNAYLKILKPMAQLLSKLGYDVAIEERHHNKKKDISGTAKTIGKILIENFKGKEKLVLGTLDREPMTNEITLSVTRCGYIPSEHAVIFDNVADTIEFKHMVRDRKIFAIGAVECAYKLLEKEPGVYNITDLI